MCIGIPMQVIRVEPGHAWVAGRGEVKRVGTALVGDCAERDWLLVFLDTARERIDAQRAAEVNAVLDLLQGALAGAPATTAEAGFALPSNMDPTTLAALTGRTD
ncbi:HypC/HybG/HupF family hydrogenase formation chaperone [Azohydromonas sediminis]|uniref:HypC/HybG/HupF family hydrogenase formation chaperone n=1 Tax=Azohydromonas sediminis TaxID=2259674 RepID=UPI000E65CF2E|nr:HypC/HybG/HupF family hydrogenase formation chaperone [Azohydromonas sediminis]